ncbi:MAG: DUF3515 family protein [Dermatophilaceae bacterium]
MSPRVRRCRPFWVGAVLLGALAACSSSTDVAAPAGAGSAACRSVAAHWPKTVGGQSLRATSSSSDAVRAWGNPAIIARCGVAPIGPTTDQCLAVSGVDWVAHRLTDGVRFTTYGRSPAIEVLVPSAYKPEPLVLPAFGAAASVIPQGEHHCQ